MLWLAYKITIKSSNGQTLHINVPGCGLMGSLDPINGVDVTVSTSHSVNQIGDSIDSQTVGGVLRTISGECQTVAAAKQLLAALPPFASGRLILNDRYFCEFVVKKSPYVVRTKGSLNGRTFSAMLYCRLPYWQSVDAVQCVLGGSVPTFRLPVNYSTLFHLDAGDNLLKIGADSGGDNLQSTISFYSVHMGVYPDDF